MNSDMSKGTAWVWPSSSLAGLGGPMPGITVNHELFSPVSSPGLHEHRRLSHPIPASSPRLGSPSPRGYLSAASPAPMSPMGFMPRVPRPDGMWRTNTSIASSMNRLPSMPHMSPVVFWSEAHPATPSMNRRPSIYNPVDVYAGAPHGDATLGDWRRTVSQFNLMATESAIPSASSSSSGSDHDDRERGGGNIFSDISGLRQISPALYHWIVSRVGTKTKVCLITSFIAFESLKFLLAEHTYVEGVNTFSILVVTNLASLTLAVTLSFIMEGGPVVHKIFSWPPFWRFLGVAVLFTFASVLILISYRIGTPSAEVVTVGYIYLPIAAVLSYKVFRRKYGLLEWLAVGMMTLAILAFVLLREESINGANQIGFVIPGFGLVVGAVAISVLASILAERIFKDRSGGLIRQRGHAHQDKFYIMKVHLDFSSLVVSVCLWMVPTSTSQPFGDVFEQWSHSKQWFGTWGQYQFLMVFVAVGQGWAAGLVTKEFSTVIKAIVQTLSVVLVMLVGDPIMHNRYHFRSREVPSILLAVIIVMSAIIFQTGRINLKVIRKAVNLGPEGNAVLNLTTLAGPENDKASPRVERSPNGTAMVELPKYPANVNRKGSNGSKPDTSDESADEDLNTSSKPLLELSTSDKKGHSSTIMKIFTTYALILVYIVSDSGRTLILQKALSTTVINSTSMGLVCYVCGVRVASGLTFWTHGLDGLRQAWSIRSIFYCLPASFLFALATALGNLSFANGISGSLYVVLGKFYTPVAALGARWIMGKFYMWLEWFALIILTLSSFVFGYLKAYNFEGGRTDDIGAPASGMVLVLASAAVSAVGSLVTEKILKGEQVPFHMQKVRLDTGSIISSFVLLPAIGMIATRPQDIPWAARPTSYETCSWKAPDNVCWMTPHTNYSCANPSCHCDCETGIFAGWNLGWASWVLILAVCVNTCQGWLVGRVTQRFSVVHRAIADSFSLLTIYFLGDPIFNHTSLSNVSLNLVAFIVPLSTATFSAATSEMQKVFHAQKTVRDRYETAGSLEIDTDSESELSELSGGPSLVRSRQNSEGSSPSSRPVAAC